MADTTSLAGILAASAAKPTSGALTQEEIDARTAAVVAAGGKSTDPNNRIKEINETAAEANARITQGYKDQPKPELTEEGKALKATIEFVRKGAGGVGQYEEVYGIGTPIPEQRTTAYGNVYDAQGNLISGSGLKSPLVSDATRLSVAERNTAAADKIRAEETAKLLARYKAQGMSDADAKKAVDEFWAEAAASYARGYEIDENGNKIPMYGSSGSGFFGTPSAAFTSAFGSSASTLTNTGSATGTAGGLASDVFKQTLALFFGAAEMAKPWANELYKVVSKYYKTGGVTAEEAFNMALLESRNNPALADFTKRFKGIYALQDMKQQGKAVTVPTIAEYFATESKMGDMLKASNLGDLANEDFLGDVLGKGVSATEFGNRITQIFDRIDTAPDVIKKTIGRYFPSLDRVQLAKALALGDKGAKQLEQELAGYEVLAGAGAQQLEASAALPGGVTLEQAQQIAKAGGTFASTLPQFGQIARARETEQKLAEISGVKSLGVTGLTSAVISKSAKELKALEDLTMQEEARFMGKAGTSPRALASQSRANRII
jgi:hypothetical protein